MLRDLYEVVTEISGGESRHRKGKVSLLLPVCLEAVRGQSLTELAREMKVSTACMTSMVDRLTARGQAMRQPVQGDRRSFEVHRTAKGEADMAALRQCILRMAQGILAKEGAGV